MDRMIRPARADDLGTLFTLQRAAFVDEAMLYGTPEVPALTETRDQFDTRHAASTTLVLEERGRIVAAVSIHDYREPCPDIERLMTAPDRRGLGLATQLMAAAERLVAAEHDAVQLVVGELAVDNRRLYERLGYREAARRVAFETVVLLDMRKSLPG